MKNFLFLSACVILAFASCKKDAAKTTTTNTITATVGGSNINFSTTAIGELASDTGAYVLEIVGLTGTSSSAQSMAVGLLSDAPFVKGTYTFNSADTTSTVTVFPIIEYIKNLSGDDSYIFGTNAGINIGDGSYVGPTSTTTVTITSISSTNVQGTFSGILVNEGDNTTTETVTNGKFNVDLKTTNLQNMNTRISVTKLRSLKNRVRN
jgi:hypothetical protein